MKISPPFIHKLKLDEVFVFGSNLQGIHGKGAAKQAVQWGAKRLKGVGLSGQTYAIPTRDYHGMNRFTTLPIKEIKKHVDVFIAFAKERPSLNFLVTPIGTGNAGYSDEQMAPLFRDALAMDNVYLPDKWVK